MSHCFRCLDPVIEDLPDGPVSLVFDYRKDQCGHCSCCQISDEYKCAGKRSDYKDAVFSVITESDMPRFVDLIAAILNDPKSFVVIGDLASADYRYRMIKNVLSGKAWRDPVSSHKLPFVLLIVFYKFITFRICRRAINQIFFFYFIFNIDNLYDTGNKSVFFTVYVNTFDTVEIDIVIREEHLI